MRFNPAGGHANFWGWGHFEVRVWRIFKSIENQFRQTLSGYERTFSKLPKVIQVRWELPKQKDFNVLIYGSVNQNRPSLLQMFRAISGTNAGGR